MVAGLAQQPKIIHAPKQVPTQSNSAIAKAVIRSLTLRQKIAQLIVVTSYGEVPRNRSSEAVRLHHAVAELGVGGLIVINRVDRYGVVQSAQPYEMITSLNGMQKMARLPLIVGGDFERGASMRVANTTKYPHNMAFNAAGDFAATRELGAATAREARALGVHWIFGPVADVNNNPDNPIINIRSFGQKSEEVAAHVRAFILGANSDPANPILLCAKHFPGHGDTAMDSHMQLARIDGTRERLDRVELLPFRAAIESQIGSIMTAHVAVPSIEPEDIPATVSRNVMTKLLREEMKFQGLIVTDAMDMQGLSRLFSPGEAAVRALDAGVDVLLMPKNPDLVIASIEKAILTKRLSLARVEASVEKLLVSKLQLGLFRNRYVNADLAAKVLDQPEDALRAQAVANHAVAMFKNEENIVPLRNSDDACFVALAERRMTTQGLQFTEEMEKLSPKSSKVLLDPTMPQGAMDETLEKSKTCGTIVIAAFVSVGAYRGDTALPGMFTALVQAFIKTGRPVILISLGNPYLLRTFPDVAAYITTYSPTVLSEIAAARAVVGEIPITGRMVVSLK